MGTAIKHPVPDRVKPSFVRAERQSARMSKITNDGLTRSGTGCFIARPTHNGNSGRQRVNIVSRKNCNRLVPEYHSLGPFVVCVSTHEGLGCHPSRFYPRDAASAGNSDRNVSVCLSVTRRYCVKTKKASGMISSPPGSPKTLVF